MRYDGGNCWRQRWRGDKQKGERMTQDEWKETVKQYCDELANPNCGEIPARHADAFRDALADCVLEGGSDDFAKLAEVAEECKRHVLGELPSSKIPGCDPFHGSR